MSITLKTINHVGIPIWDRRVSLKFYRDILGLKVIPSMVDSPNIVWTRTNDGTMVHLIEPADGENLVDPHTAFEVEDFDETVEDRSMELFKDVMEQLEEEKIVRKTPTSIRQTFKVITNETNGRRAEGA